jgi:hypothetical protein
MDKPKGATVWIADKDLEAHGQEGGHIESGVALKLRFSRL